MGTVGKYVVTVNTVEQYEVDAFDAQAARQAVAFIPEEVAEAGIPQLLDRRTTSIQIEEGDVVRVQFQGKLFKSQPYAFRLPEGVSVEDVAVGDEFTAPSIQGGETVVTVVFFGRGDYTGPLQTLTGRVVR